MFTLTKFGDWNKVGRTLKRLSVYLFPVFAGKIDESGELFLEKLRSHIDNQDLPWTPLSQKTIQLKGGDTTIYVETGFLRDNMKALKITESNNKYSIFVGALDSTITPTGERLSDVMVWMEYGTNRMPPRPLIRPTVEEMAKECLARWGDALKNLLRSI
jgi:hypothetical protein